MYTDDLSVQCVDSGCYLSVRGDLFKCFEEGRDKRGFAGQTENRLKGEDETAIKNKEPT